MRDASNSLKALVALFGPLGVAIIRNEVAVAENLIQRHPETLDELNFNDETNCSLAVGRPEVLNAIAMQATPAQLAHRNRWDRVTPMGKAIMISKAICETRGGVDESLCPCVVAVKILLEADCPIIPSRDFWDTFRDENLFSKASRHCKVLVAKSLQTRRRGLRQMAKESLHPADHSRFCSSEAELDYQAMELDSELRRKGFLSFGRLSAEWPSSENYIGRDTTYYSSVYSNLDNPDDASIFWNVGFRDVGICSRVWPPHYDWIKRPAACLSNHSSPEYSLWLIEHCPRFWEFVCHHYALEGPDYVLAEIIGYTIYHSSFVRRVELLKLISNKLSKVEIADSCTCQCAPEGCTPFDLAIKWLSICVPWNKPSYLLLSLLFEDQSGALDLSRYIVMIRQATFNALDMIHTCKDRPVPYIYSGCENDYEEEDFERARYLDGVVMEFQDFVRREDKAVEDESSDTSADIKEKSSNKDTVNCQRILEFWNKVWPSRIRAIKEELAATWNPDQTVLEDLGVSLWYEEEVDEDGKLVEPEQMMMRRAEDLKRDLSII